MALTKIGTDGFKDDAVTLAKQAGGTDGQIITYDASGNPVAVGPGTDGQVLTSTGAGSPPAFEDASGTTINNNADNRVITGSGTANTLEGESGLTYNGTRLNVGTGDLAVTGAEGGDAQLRLTADEGDDGADYWRLESKASDNNFNLATYASGAWVDKLSLDTSGTTTLKHSNDSGATTLKLENNSTANSTDPKVKIAVDLASGKDGGSIEFIRESNYQSSAAADSAIVISPTKNDTNQEAVRITQDWFRLHSNCSGIQFNGDTASANALNDYEEGTYIPTMTGQTSTTDATLYSNEQRLSYHKIGSLVTIHGRVRLSGADYAGQLRLSLPFTADSGLSTSNAGCSAVATYGVNFENDGVGTGHNMCLFLETGQGSALAYFLINRDDSNWVAATSSHIGSGDYLCIQHTYKAA